MSRFYFHVRSNGRLAVDMRGRQYDEREQAYAHAIQSVPQLLADALQSRSQLSSNPLQHGNTYVTIEVTDEKRRTCVVKGTIVVVKR
jgi:hypothetical protein